METTAVDGGEKWEKKWDDAASGEVAARLHEGDRGTLLGDLKYLRKGPGLTLPRLMEASEVVRALGGAEQLPETLRERLLSAVRSLDDRRGRPSRAALPAAFGADEEGARDLQQRRANFAASVQRASYTVREWEDDLLAELALRLLTGYYSGSLIPAQLPVPHGGYLLTRLQVRTLIRDRRFIQARQSREVLSLVDGAAGFVYGSYSPTKLHEVIGGELTLSKQAPGGVIHQITFPRPLRRGERHSFSFTETVPDDTKPVEPSDQDFAGQTFESPTLQYDCRVDFEGKQPAVVWPTTSSAGSSGQARRRKDGRSAWISGGRSASASTTCTAGCALG